MSEWLGATCIFLGGGIFGFGLMAILSIGRYAKHDFGRDAPSLLTAQQVAKRLGMSRRWVYDNSRDFPFTIKTGRRSLRFDPVRLNEYIDDGQFQGKAKARRS